MITESSKWKNRNIVFHYLMPCCITHSKEFPPNFATSIKQIWEKLIDFYPRWNHKKTYEKNYGFLMILGRTEVN